MTPPLPLELWNRFQALTEEGDSGDEAESEQEVLPPLSWWLTEENLLGEVELDYAADTIEKVDTKPAIKDIEGLTKEEVKDATYKMDSDTKPAPVTTIKPSKSGLIAKKDIVTTQVEGQDPVTGGATPLETVEGLPTGAGTCLVDSTQRQMIDIPPIRTQQMGLCSVQMIRLAASKREAETTVLGDSRDRAGHQGTNNRARRHQTVVQ